MTKMGRLKRMLSPDPNDRLFQRLPLHLCVEQTIIKLEVLRVPLLSPTLLLDLGDVEMSHQITYLILTGCPMTSDV